MSTGSISHVTLHVWMIAKSKRHSLLTQDYRRLSIRDGVETGVDLRAFAFVSERVSLCQDCLHLFRRYFFVSRYLDGCWQ